jgi:hypothetical protein
MKFQPRARDGPWTAHEHAEATSANQARSVSMILHHFTRAVDLPGIADRGLIPSVPDMRTLGRPVVWLTTAETMKPSDGDLAWLEMRRGTIFSDAEIERLASALVVGLDTRLTVRLEPNGRRLAHYATWLRKHQGVLIDAANDCGWRNNNGDLFRTADIAAALPPSAQANWYVYFGAIPPARIAGWPVATIPRAANQNDRQQAAA